MDQQLFVFQKILHFFWFCFAFSFVFWLGAGLAAIVFLFSLNFFRLFSAVFFFFFFSFFFFSSFFSHSLLAAIYRVKPVACEKINMMSSRG